MVAWWVPYWSWVHQQTWICIGEGMITGSQLAGSATLSNSLLRGQSERFCSDRLRLSLRTGSGRGLHRRVHGSQTKH